MDADYLQKWVIIARRFTSAYQEALEKLGWWKKRHADVNHAWFSDTFILFTNDDSDISFTEIEMVCRWFAFSLIRGEIPVRGAMAYGGFYVDRKNSLYLGPALLEAYEWGENQNWLGFILCPSTVKKLKDLNLPVSHNYACCEVPLKNKADTPASDIPACLLGNLMRSSNDILLGMLEKMRDKQSKDSVREKYVNTIEFILKHDRKPIEMS